MALTKTLREIFRDYVTDGVPASGANSPSKADIRQWGDEVEAELALEGDTIVTAAGAYTVLLTDRRVIIHRTVAEAAAINLPSVALATGAVKIKDGAGNFASFNQTLTPNGTDTIVGLSTYVLSGDYQTVTLTPYVRAGADVWFIEF